MPIQVRAIEKADRAWILRLLRERWGTERFASREKLRDASQLPGFAAFRDGKPIGLLTYEIENDECEIITMNALEKTRGIGTALIETLEQYARRRDCRRLRLVTTNDNLPALGFYQKRGFQLAALRRGAVEAARRTLKPEIPLTGYRGISIRDEFELEMELESR